MGRLAAVGRENTRLEHLHTTTKTTKTERANSLETASSLKCFTMTVGIAGNAAKHPEPNRVSKMPSYMVFEAMRRNPYGRLLKPKPVQSHQERSCGTKIGFRSHVRAMNFIGTNLRSLQLPYLRAYKCGYCQRWHIGHLSNPA